MNCSLNKKPKLNKNKMTEKVINLEPNFSMNNQYLVKNMQECFDTLNKFLKSKSGETVDPLFIRENGRKVELGYKPRTKDKTHFYSNESFDGSSDSLTRACILGFVIFEGCKEYGCYADVPMCGAPEENDESYFTFTFEDVSYKYIIWNKR